MAANYQTVLEKDFSSGMNKLASEDAVPPTFVEDLENMNPNAQGYVEKRKGYEPYGGFLPLRVYKAVRVNGNQLFLYFDELSGGTATIDFSTLKSTPVMLYGSSTIVTGTPKYYPSFVVDPRVVLGQQNYVLPAAEIGATSRDLFVGLGYNDPSREGTKNNETVYADLITVNPTTFDVEIDSVSGLPPGEPKCFVYVKDHKTVAGESWAATVTEDTLGSGTFTVGQATHQLNTQNYITRYYNPVSGEEIFPDSVTVTGSTIVAQFSGQAKPASVRFVVASIPEIDVGTATIQNNVTDVSRKFPIAADFAFFEVYQKSGSSWFRVMPDKIDLVDQEAFLYFTNESGSSAELRILWERASVRTNKIRLDDTKTITSTTEFQVGNKVSYNGTAWILNPNSTQSIHSKTGPVLGVYTYTLNEDDLAPQLCLYGLDHANIYPSNPKRSGWVSHIDSYKSEGENYLIAGLGWNLFKAAYDVSLPSRQPLLRTTVASEVIIGPLFGPAGRTRPSYSFTGGGEGWGNIGYIKYYAEGVVEVKVLTPNRTSNAGTGLPVDLEHDRLTIQGASQKVHRGEWAIKYFDASVSDYIIFRIYNASITTPDYDEEDIGEAGVFTDKVEFNPESNSVWSLLYGDLLESEAFPQGLSGSLACVSTSGNHSWLNGVGERITMPGGQVYTVRRTGKMLKVRNVNSPASVPYEGFVVGDVLAFSDRERKHTIRYITPTGDASVAVSFDGLTGEALVTNVDSSNYVVGQKVVLASCGRYSGEYVIKALENTTSITLDSSNVKDSTTSTSVGVTPRILGQVFELSYEDELYDDPNSLLTVSVPLRWLSLENPAGSASRVKHLESKAYTEQQFVRSVMAQDNMYFANYSDHLMKYDGVNLYRSGLIRWQPQVFATADAGYSGKIIVPAKTTLSNTVTVDLYRLEVSSDNAARFTVGDKINIKNNVANGIPIIFTVVDKYTISTGNFHVILDQKIVAGGNPLTITWVDTNVYRYYFRLTAYDANDNVVTSATTGANEFYISLAESAAVRLRLLGLPKLEQLNYSKIYLEVYRTKRNTVAPFYNITKLPIKFDVTKPYIDVIDTISDEALPAQPDDAVLTFLAGANLGNGLSQPPQAKYCTVTDNRLVLANIQDDPRIKVDIYGNPTLASFDNQVFYLRKDSTTTTNDLGFELQTNGVQVISAGLNNDSTFTLTLSAAGNFVVGEWLYLFHDTAANKEQLTACGWHKVTVGGTGVTSVTVQLGVAPTWTQTTLVAASNLYNVGNKLLYNSTTNTYSLAPDQNAPGTDYYLVVTKVAIPNSSNSTYTLTHYMYPSKLLKCSILTPGPTSFPVYLGADYNYSWRNANVDLLYSAAARTLLRLSNAINFSQSVSSSPWLFANAGLDLGGQTLLLSFPENSLRTTPELVMPASLGNIEYYGNGVKVSAGGENVGATTQKFPSRLVISYVNYAEVFHRPFDQDGTGSDSIVDVNPADGQEITGVFPFFSESAFGAALKSSSLIVFKSNSIYVVDVASRRAQQLESNGLGCTAPYSIAATREGIMFANEAGLYRLTRALTVEPIGSYVDRLWRQDVEKSQLDLMHGHAYGVGRKYKVSYPLTGQKVPSDVLVYDYTKEDTKNSYGSWTRYTNHAATGWCNLLEDAFFCTTSGRVYQVASGNSKYDYADDGRAIQCSSTFRALDFGDSAIRKRVLHLLVHYRIPQLLEGSVDVNTASVGMAVNLVDSFQPLDTFYLDVPNKPDGLSTLTPNKQVTIRYAVRNPKSLYFQTKISDNGLHTPLQVTGLSFRVAGLGTEGITEAAQTSPQGSSK
jgi:hypothetical protein